MSDLEESATANDERQENYERLLTTHHGRMIEFVKFAEAKNAALVTFCSIWIGSILTVLRFNETLPLGYDWYLKSILPLLVIAALVSLSGLLPRLLHHFHKPGDEAKNLLYFRHIAEFDRTAYASKLRERYFAPAGATYTQSYLHDLEIQIAVQACIADRKFRIFNWAAVVVMGAFGLLLVPAVWELIRIGVQFGTVRGWF